MKDDRAEAGEQASERREAFAADVSKRTGIDDAMIDELVRAFYARIRADEVLGPVFSARITDWELHLERMCAFWSSVALMSGRYHGRPMPAHARLPVDSRHFDRWLMLFGATAREVCPVAAAELLISKAATIAHSLELGVASSRGELLAAGERLQPVSN